MVDGYVNKIKHWEFDDFEIKWKWKFWEEKYC